MNYKRFDPQENLGSNYANKESYMYIIYGFVNLSIHCVEVNTPPPPFPHQLYNCFFFFHISLIPRPNPQLPVTCSMQSGIGSSAWEARLNDRSYQSCDFASYASRFSSCYTEIAGGSPGNEAMLT